MQTQYLHLTTFDHCVISCAIAIQVCGDKVRDHAALEHAVLNSESHYATVCSQFIIMQACGGHLEVWTRYWRRRMWRRNIQPTRVSGRFLVMVHAGKRIWCICSPQGCPLESIFESICFVKNRPFGSPVVVHCFLLIKPPPHVTVERGH